MKMNFGNTGRTHICVYLLMWVLGIAMWGISIVMVFGIAFGFVKDVTVFECASVLALGIVACMDAKLHMPERKDDDGKEPEDN